MPDKYKLDGIHCIKLRNADNPGNINWKNVIKFFIKLFFKNLIIYSSKNLNLNIKILL